jgi:hypothetical protein
MARRIGRPARALWADGLVDPLALCGPTDWWGALRDRAAADCAVRYRRAEAAVPRAWDPRREVAALAITEPDAGSDVASIPTHARKVDGGYVVNGSKTFITGGARADVLVTSVAGFVRPAMADPFMLVDSPAQDV